MCAQRAVQLVELFPAGCGNGNGHAQVFAALALSQLNRAGIKVGVKLGGDHGDGMHQAVHFEAHDFDGKERRVLYERLAARLIGMAGYGHDSGRWGGSVGGCAGCWRPAAEVAGQRARDAHE